MNDGALFTDLQENPAPRRRRNSPRHPSQLSVSSVATIRPEERAGVAQQLVRLLSALGVDRVQLAEMIGLSRSSTSHWHHGANGISRHNLAVLIDAARERAPAAIQALGDLLRCEVAWSWFVQAGPDMEKVDCRRKARPVIVEDLELLYGSTEAPLPARLAFTGASGSREEELRRVSFSDVPIPPVAAATSKTMTWAYDGTSCYTCHNLRIVADADGSWWLRVNIGFDVEVQFHSLAAAFEAAHYMAVSGETDGSRAAGARDPWSVDGQDRSAGLTR